MSQATARASRREIRRSFGGEDVIGSLQRLAKTGEGLAEVVAQHEDRVACVEQELSNLSVVARDHARALTEVRTDVYERSFWARLRWLICGR